MKFLQQQQVNQALLFIIWLALFIFDTATGQQAERVWYVRSPEGNRVNSVAWNPDGSLFVSGGDLNLWDATTQTLIEDPIGHGVGNQVRSVDFHPNGKEFASGGDGNNLIRIWDLLGEEKSLRAATSSVHSIAYSPDGSGDIVAASGSDVSILHSDGTTQTTFVGSHTGLVRSVAYNSDGSLVASSGDNGDGTVKVWDIDGNLRLNLMPSTVVQGVIWAVAFSPDDKYILSGGTENDDIIIWDATNGDIVQKLPGGGGRLRSLSFSSDGRWLASLHDDSKGVLWDTTTWQMMGDFGGGFSVCFHPDNKHVLVGASSGVISLWNIESLMGSSQTTTTPPPSDSTSPPPSNLDSTSAASSTKINGSLSFLYFAVAAIFSVSLLSS